MKPTLGRIVIFVEGPGIRRGEERAAIIHGVHENSVDITVLGPGYQVPAAVCDVPYSEESRPHSWHWPVREKV